MNKKYTSPFPANREEEKVGAATDIEKLAGSNESPGEVFATEEKLKNANDM